MSRIPVNILSDEEFIKKVYGETIDFVSLVCDVEKEELANTQSSQRFLDKVEMLYALDSFAVRNERGENRRNRIINLFCHAPFIKEGNPTTALGQMSAVIEDILYGEEKYLPYMQKMEARWGVPPIPHEKQY